MKSKRSARFIPRFDAWFWQPLCRLVLDLNIRITRMIASKLVPAEQVCVADPVKAKRPGGGAA